MRKIIGNMCVIMFAGCIANSAFAVTMNEENFGDFSSNVTVISIGELDSGVNTISGSISGSCSTANFNNCSGDTADVFNFTLPSGEELISLNLTISNLLLTSDPNAQFPRPQRGFYVLSRRIGQTSFNVISPTSFTSNLSVELLSNSIDFDPLIITVGVDSNSDSSGEFGFDWQALLEVSSLQQPDDTAVVPLPRSISFLALAMILIIGFRQRYAQC